MPTYLDEFKAIAEESKNLQTWALTIIGASIFTIIGTSYLQPKNTKTRLFYLLFIPGWVCMGFCMYYGDFISRTYIASILSAPKVYECIEKGLEDTFKMQMNCFIYGLGAFGLWLMTYLFWWIFYNNKNV